MLENVQIPVPEEVWEGFAGLFHNTKGRALDNILRTGVLPVQRVGSMWALYPHHATQSRNQSQQRWDDDTCNTLCCADHMMINRIIPPAYSFINPTGSVTIREPVVREVLTRVISLRAKSTDTDMALYDCSFSGMEVVDIIDQAFPDRVDSHAPASQELAEFARRAAKDGWTGRVFACTSSNGCRAINPNGMLQCLACGAAFVFADEASGSWFSPDAKKDIDAAAHRDGLAVPTSVRVLPAVIARNLMYGADQGASSLQAILKDKFRSAVKHQLQWYPESPTCRGEELEEMAERRGMSPYSPKRYVHARWNFDAQSPSSQWPDINDLFASNLNLSEETVGYLATKVTREIIKAGIFRSDQIDSARVPRDGG